MRKTNLGALRAATATIPLIFATTAHAQEAPAPAVG